MRLALIAALLLGCATSPPPECRGFVVQIGARQIDWIADALQEGNEPEAVEYAFLYHLRRDWRVATGGDPEIPVAYLHQVPTGERYEAAMASLGRIIRQAPGRPMPRHCLQLE